MILPYNEKVRMREKLYSGIFDAVLFMNIFKTNFWELHAFL